MSCELTIKYKFWAPGMETPEDLQLSITRSPGPATRREIDFYTSDKHGHAEWNAYDVTIQSDVGEPVDLKIESPRLVDNGNDTYTYKGTINLPKLDDTCAMCLPKSRKRIELYNIDKYQPYFHAPLVDRVEGDAEEIILSADGRERSASYNEPGSMTINAAGGVWTRFDKVVKLEQQIHQIVDASADVSTYNFDVTTSCSETSNPGTGGYNNSKSMDFRREAVGYMTCGDVDTFNNATEFSASFWCLSLDRDDSNGNRNIFCVGDASNSIRVFRGSNDEIRFAIHVGTAGTIFASTGGENPISMSGWNHVVVSYKIDPSIGSGQGVGRVYINGELKAESSQFAKTDETTFTGEFNIGRLRWLNNQYWAGLIDELAIWNVELQSDDVTTLYNNGIGTTDIGSLPGLTHWWRMEEGDGTTVVNSAAPGVNDATIVNVTPHNSLKFSDNVPELQPWNDNNYSVKFPGEGGDFLTTDFLTSEYNIKDKFTLSLWVKLDNTEGTQDFIGRYIGGNDRWYFGISGSKIRVGLGNGYDASTHEHGIVAGEWTHVAFTWDGGYGGSNKLKYYRDGEFVGELTSFAWSNDNLASTHLPYIGGLNSDGTAANELSGRLDELAVFGHTMTDSEIGDIYNNGIATDIKSSKPVAWWRMGDNDNGAGTVVTDVGLGSNHATMNGDVSFVSDTTTNDEDTTTTGDSNSSDPYDPYVSGNSCAYVFIDYKNRPLVNNPALLAQVNDTLIFDRVTHDDHGLTESSFMRMKIDNLNTGETVAEQNQDSTDWQMSWTPDTAGLYEYSSQDSNPSAGGEILVTDNGESVIYVFNKKQFRSARGQVNVKIAGQSESMYMTTDFRLIQWTDSQDTTDVALDHGTFLTTDNSNSTTTLGTYVSQDHIYITMRNMSQQAVISGDVTLLS